MPNAASALKNDFQPNSGRRNVRSRDEILADLPAIAAEIADGAAARELNRTLPFEIFQRLRRTGLTYLRIPKSLGGPGGSLADQVEVTCALAAADSSVGHALRGHFGFLEAIAVEPFSDASRKYVDEILSGKIFGGAFMEIGTPRPNMIRTTLVKGGDTYRLNGSKYYTTGAMFADYISFTALDEAGGFTSALIPADRKGIHVLDDWEGMGQRMTASGGIDMEDVEVFPHEITPRSTSSSFSRRHNATRAQLHLLACVGGIVRNVLSDAVTYVQNHARSAKHSASETARGDQFVQQTVGDIAASSYIIDATIADVARTLDASAIGLVTGAPDIDELVLQGQLANSKAQVIIGKLAIRAAEQIFDTGGGSATARKLNFDRHWRNVRTILNHNPLFLKGRVIGDYYLNGVRADFDEGRVF